MKGLDTEQRPLKGYFVEVSGDDDEVTLREKE